MKVLRKVNLVLFILIVSVFGYYLITGRNLIPEYLYFPITGYVFFISGLEELSKKEKDKILGSAYIGVGIVGLLSNFL
ncbi:hypothetical protein VBD025_16640 [Virgibacillus flavescens]|uniref:hypothetical protein n=1 Tax=Virgibacillus flavescens TaxID=1611422 RepID=UPI003D34D2DD